MENENENENKNEDGEIDSEIDGRKEIVAAARSIVAGMTKVSPTTAAGYKAKSQMLMANRQAQLAAGGDDWAALLMPYAPNGNSYYVMSSALKWVLKTAIGMMVKRYDSSDNQGQRDDAAAYLKSFLLNFYSVSEISRQALLERSGQPVRPARSKRGNGKGDGWGHAMVSVALKSQKWGPAVWVLHELGCRPRELLNGIKLELLDDVVRLRVIGAKVRAHLAGQDWHEVDVPITAVPNSIFEKIVADGGTTVVRIASDVLLRNQLAKWGRRLWPKGPRISAIDFRHSVAEDLREQGWSASEIAEVLGHAVEGTSKRYGRRRRPGQRKKTLGERALVRGSATVSTPVRALKKNKKKV